MKGTALVQDPLMFIQGIHMYRVCSHYIHIQGCCNQDDVHKHIGDQPQPLSFHSSLCIHHSILLILHSILFHILHNKTVVQPQLQPQHLSFHSSLCSHHSILYILHSILFHILHNKTVVQPQPLSFHRCRWCMDIQHIHIQDGHNRDDVQH